MAPIRTPTATSVDVSTSITPRGTPNNRPPVMVQPDWSDPPRVARSWATEIGANIIDDSEHRIRRASRPRLSASALHHGTTDVERGHLWGLLESASPKLVVPVLDRLELTAPLGYSWPYAIMADSVAVASVSNQGGGTARVTCTALNRRFAAGARVWLYATDTNAAGIVLLGRTLGGLLAVVSAVSSSYVDIVLDLAATPVAFPARGLAIAPAFDALPITDIDIEHVTAKHSRCTVEATEYRGANQYPPLNAGDVSSLFTYFLGEPAWFPDHNWNDSLRLGLQRTNENRDSGLGDIVWLSGITPRLSLEVQSLLPRAAWWRILNLFDSRKGSAGCFWTVTNAEVFGALALGSGTTSLSGLPATIQDYTLLDLADALAFIKSDGRFELARVNSVAHSSGTLDITLQDTVPAGSYIRVALAFRGHFASDTLEEEWLTTNVVRSSFSIVQTNPEYDVEF